MSWYLGVLKKYAVFEGRARRKEYWMFVLFNFIISFVLSYISASISTLYLLAVILPGIAVSVRRLHDIGKSGFWLLVSFIPIIGSIILLVFMCLDSQAGTNTYGPNPKEETENNFMF
ncbi:MAG: DUF805 domain-containing protein [Clostridiales bacterium]|nr:DUF805 domain-containing protein [Clostridiales bacterium]